MAYSKNPELPKVRQEAVRLVKQERWTVRKVARHLGYTHSAVVKWCKKDRWYGSVPIHTESARPKHSPRALSETVVTAIFQKRLGRRRCGQVIHQELLGAGVAVSLSSVQRTLKRLHMVKPRSPWKRPHDRTPRPEATFPGALVETDTIHVRLPSGGTLYVYTLIDIHSRWAYAEAVRTIGAEHSATFIDRAQAQAPFRFCMVQSDHGSEFSTRFTHRLKTHQIQHRHARVRQKNDQAHVERFNRTIQDECLDLVPHSLLDFKRAIKTYLPYYNHERLHMGINFKTPMQMLKAVPRS